MEHHGTTHVAPDGCGWILFQDESHEIEAWQDYLGPSWSNNEAEYQGLINGQLEYQVGMKISYRHISRADKLKADELANSAIAD